MGRSLLLFVFIIAAIIELGARHQPKQEGAAGKKEAVATTIFLVRHAEKETADPADKDPDLTAAGLQRAKALAQYLQGTQIDGFFSTPYKRTQNTLSFLNHGRPILFYDAHDTAALRHRVLEEFQGKTVVIVGHSNTLLPIIDAFGAKRPLEQIGEDQYNYLFKLQVLPKGKATVRAFTFGA